VSWPLSTLPDERKGDNPPYYPYSMRFPKTFSVPIGVYHSIGDVNKTTEKDKRTSEVLSTLKKWGKLLSNQLTTFTSIFYKR
jgi:hypothetical protein